MKSIMLVALLTVAGCSKKPAPADTGTDCSAPINKGMDNMASALNGQAAPQMKEMLLGVVTQLRATMMRRCTEDKWSADALTCMGKVSSQREIKACEVNLTQEQRTKLTTEIQQVMLGLRSGGAGHTAPAPSPGAGTPAPEGSSAAPAGAPGGAAGAPGAAGTPAGSAAAAGSAAPAAGW
jgi:hypothetical protein